MKKFRVIACGGTFDHFHNGHKDFLRFALSFGEKVIVGVTSEEFVGKEKKEKIESYIIRQNAVSDFLQSEGAGNRSEVISIDDVFGPTLSSDLYIDGLAVSTNSQKGAKIINAQRQKQGLSKLAIFVHAMLQGEDGQIISSSRIRKGEINREGKPYLNSQWFLKPLFLTDEIRDIVKKPLGTLKSGNVGLKHVDPSMLIAVGDVVTKMCNDAGIKQKISSVDLRVGRIETFHNLKELGFDGSERVVHVSNPSGSLTPELFTAIQSIFTKNYSQRVVLQIVGEEDLSVLPLVLTAPLNFVVLYGQPKEGVVRVTVSEQNKEYFYNLTSRFSD